MNHPNHPYQGGLGRMICCFFAYFRAFSIIFSHFRTFSHFFADFLPGPVPPGSSFIRPLFVLPGPSPMDDFEKSSLSSMGVG